MTKLSDTALVILSVACRREGARILPLTANLKGGAVNIVLGSLLKRGLIEAVAAEAGDAVWGDQDDAPMTLRASAAAFAALGIETLAEVPGSAAPRSRKARSGATDRKPWTKPVGDSAAPKRETKQALLVDMLRRPGGATISDRRGDGLAQPHRPRRDRRRIEEAARTGCRFREGRG